MDHKTDSPGAHNIIALSPLPEPDFTSYQTDSTMRSMELRSFSDNQMREYARQEVFRAEEAWKARASLAASAGSEPSEVSKRRAKYLLNDTDAARSYVGRFFQSIGRHDFDDYSQHELAGDFACVLASALSAHPSPPEGAGAESSEWVSMPRVLPLHGPLRDVLIDWVGRAVKGECYLYSAFWAALVAAAPPASEAKEQ